MCALEPASTLLAHMLIAGLASAADHSLIRGAFRPRATGRRDPTCACARIGIDCDTSFTSYASSLCKHGIDGPHAVVTARAVALLKSKRRQRGCSWRRRRRRMLACQRGRLRIPCMHACMHAPILAYIIPMVVGKKPDSTQGIAHMCG